MTRAPAGRVATPGRRTFPATSTVTFPPVVPPAGPTEVDALDDGTSGCADPEGAAPMWAGTGSLRPCIRSTTQTVPTRARATSATTSRAGPAPELGAAAQRLRHLLAHPAGEPAGDSGSGRTHVPTHRRHDRRLRQLDRVVVDAAQARLLQLTAQQLEPAACGVSDLLL